MPATLRVHDVRVRLVSGDVNSIRPAVVTVGYELG